MRFYWNSLGVYGGIWTFLKIRGSVSVNVHHHQTIILFRVYLGSVIFENSGSDTGALT